MQLVSLQASQLRVGKRIRSGIFKALACGMADRTVLASLSNSASPRGISSTEILMRHYRRLQPEQLQVRYVVDSC